MTAGADELALSGQGEASRNATMDAIARAPLLESVRPPAARCGWMARVVLARGKAGVPDGSADE